MFNLHFICRGGGDEHTGQYWRDPTGPISGVGAVLGEDFQEVCDIIQENRHIRVEDT